MTAQVVQIWRHPIKSHGREALRRVAVTAGQTLPWDRTWAIAHEASKADGTEWASSRNFSIVSKTPRLMAITADLDETTEQVTLHHPDQASITLHPERDAQTLLDWVRPLVPEGRATPDRVVRVPGRGMTDTPYPSITIGNLASHRAVESRIGHALSPLRWRSNIFLDGLAPWEEFEWIGRDITIGTARFAVRERTLRCMSTAANPETGQRDADTLGTLNTAFGHQDFCVYAEPIGSGTLAIDDAIKVH